jgi:predicted RNA-binding Zn ribbon-like protein
MVGRTDTTEELPFKYVGGDPAVDLVNTVDWTSTGLKDERLGDYQRVLRWAEEAGVLSTRAAQALRRRAAAHPREAEAAHRAVQRARQVIHRLFYELADGSSSTEAVQDFNQLLGPVLEHLRLQRARSRDSKPRLELGWEQQEETLESVLWPVLWSAAALITSADAEKIRVCGAADCGWMYVDRSRNGFRRWCQMETCGTREKTRRRRLTPGLAR